MFIPDYAVSLEAKIPQIRLGLQGDSGTGKTFAALEFPNVIPIDFDGNLGRFAGSTIKAIPFRSAEFIATYNGGKFKSKAEFPRNIDNVKDAFLHFIYNDATKFTEEQTMLIDSWSSLQDHFDNYFYANPMLAKSGKEDGMAFWQEKINYAAILFAGIKRLKCHVIVTFHEYKLRNEITGNLTDKIAPLMQGSYKDRLKQHFTEFFRLTTKQELKDGKPTGDTRYMMQVRSDNSFDAIHRTSFKPGGTHYDVTSPGSSVWKFYKEQLGL
jgi:hypothetical protein